LTTIRLKAVIGGKPSMDLARLSTGTPCASSRPGRKTIEPHGACAFGSEGDGGTGRRASGRRGVVTRAGRWTLAVGDPPQS
jgi:hypothetical protein